MTIYTEQLPTIYTSNADLEESTLATTVQVKRLIATKDKGMILDTVFNDKKMIWETNRDIGKYITVELLLYS